MVVLVVVVVARRGLGVWAGRLRQSARQRQWAPCSL